HELLGVRLAVHRTADGRQHRAVEQVAADEVEQEHGEHQRDVELADRAHDVLFIEGVGLGAGLIELGLHLGGHALLREGLRVEAVAHEHGGAHADHGGDDHDPQHELHQAHHGDAHDLAHHQLEGLHAADEHFHDAVLLLLHHPAHHLH